MSTASQSNLATITRQRWRGVYYLPIWGIELSPDTPQLGEVVCSWNGDGVFTGREPHSSHKNLMRGFSRTFLIAGILLIGTTFLASCSSTNVDHSVEHEETSREERILKAKKADLQGMLTEKHNNPMRIERYKGQYVYFTGEIKRIDESGYLMLHHGDVYLEGASGKAYIGCKPPKENIHETLNKGQVVSVAGRIESFGLNHPSAVGYRYIILDDCTL